MRLACLGTVLLLLAFHVPLLQGVADLLIVEEPIEEYDLVMMMGGEHRIQVAAEHYHAERVQGVLMIRLRPTYLLEAGILPAEHDTVRTELISAGVPADRIEELDAPEAVDLFDVARLLKARLAAKPDLRVLVITEALSGSQVRMVLDDILGREAASRVTVQGLPYEGFDEGRWWRSRSGLKQVFSQYCDLAFVLMMGTDPRDPSEIVDPDAIERDLEQRYGEAACYAF